MFCWKGSKIHHVYPLRGNQDPAPRLHYCYLTALPLSFHSLISMLEPTLWNSGKGTQKGFCAQEPHRVLLGFRLLPGTGVSIHSLLPMAGLINKWMDGRTGEWVDTSVDEWKSG